MIAWLKRVFRALLPNTVRAKGGVQESPMGSSKEGSIEAEWKIK